MSSSELERIVRGDETLVQILEAARVADLPQWRLVAGCIYQTVWNAQTGRAPGTGINDYDVIYFDDTDLSVAGEQERELKLRDCLAALPLPLEVRNQARVHLWFEEYFGIAYPALKSADEAITRYASATHAVGIRLLPDDTFDVFAPFGLQDIFALTIRPNYALPNKATHDRKAERARRFWPEVTVLPW
ncbi:MAG: nucleotidyltransferase family protein [Pseudomonadota bacterium]